MAYQTLKLRLVGKNAIILHNGRTADPLDEYAKALKSVTSKTKKTDADHEQMALLEFLAGFYVVDGDLVLPDHVIEASMVAGAKKTKSGPKAKAGVFVMGNPSLQFSGRPDVPTFTTAVLAKLFSEGQHHLSSRVTVNGKRVIRTRPYLRDWSCVVDLEYDEEFVNREQVIGFLRDAGRQVGLCDWRPKYGRFDVEVQERDGV